MNDIPTPEEFKVCIEHTVKANKTDIEYLHKCLDELMMALLKDLGYGEGVDIIESAPKWYA